MAKVSIIVPVYNARDYIVTCMESLMNQTMDDIEVIFVDDHGTDDSIEVARRRVEAYDGPKSFRFVETPSNSGPGIARNTGIQYATGEYVAFVDSDDWIEITFCELLYKAASKREADIACCDIYLDNVSDSESRVAENPRIKDGDFTDKKRVGFMTRYVSYFTTYIYRRQFLLDNGLWFPQTRSAEDSCFLTCCVLAAGKIASVRKPLYHYMIREASLSFKADPLRYQQKLASFNEMMSYARKHDLYEGSREELDFIYIKKAFLMAVFTYVKNTPQRDSKVLGSIHDELLMQIPDYRSNRYLRRNLKVRMLVGMIRRHPALAGFVISRYVSGKGRMI